MATKNPHAPILGKLVEKKQHALRRAHVMLQKGREWLSPLELEPPIGYKKQKSLAEQIREQVRSEHLRQAALAAGAETFEEADDFDIPDDDFDPKSPYEEVFDPPIDRRIPPGTMFGPEPEVGPGRTATQPQNVAPDNPAAGVSPPAAGQGQGGAQPPPLAAANP